METGFTSNQHAKQLNMMLGTSNKIPSIEMNHIVGCEMQALFAIRKEYFVKTVVDEDILPAWES